VIVFPDTFYAEYLLLLTTLLESTGSPPHAFLYTNNITPGEGTVWADLVEAAYTGYADVDLADGTWGTPFISPEGDTRIASQLAFHFDGLGGGSPVTVYGWGIVNNGKTELLCAERFVTPIEIDDAADQVNIWATVILSRIAGLFGLSSVQASP